MTNEHSRWENDWPPDLKEVDDARYAAMLAGDTAALDRLLADELVYTHSDGQSDTKEQYLAAITNGTLQYTKCERGAAHLLPLGDQVLARGSLRLEALFKARRTSIHIHYLAVWSRQRGGPWKLMAWASTRLPE